MGRAPAEAILDLAQRLVQTGGYHGFSFADLAQELGVSTAAIHYHFPGKDRLGARLVQRYRTAFNASLAAIGARGGALARLRAYAALYAAVLASGERICLCGMLASELATLPPAVRSEVRAFFADNEAWLAGVLASGRDAGELRLPAAPRAAARGLVGALEGAMLLARCQGGVRDFRASARQQLAMLTNRR